MGFICEVVNVQPNTKLVMEYSGIYKGLGVWTISENNRRCDVAYEIDLEVNHRLIRILSYLLPVDKIHYNLVEKVFLGLEQKLVIKYGRGN
jgi:ribosome-associated toxin RatA of RatAB toxin-antitoxin module